LETPSFDRKKLLYECKVSCKKIVKGIDILILKIFGIIYVKSMVRKWCGILVIYTQQKYEKIFYANKNTNFHNYVINIHSFNPKAAYDLHDHDFQLLNGTWGNNQLNPP